MSSITADVLARRPDVPLNLADILDLLTAAVDQCGGALVVGSLPGADMPHGIHRFACAGAPRGIVGHSLSPDCRTSRSRWPTAATTAPSAILRGRIPSLAIRVAGERKRPTCDDDGDLPTR